MNRDDLLLINFCGLFSVKAKEKAGVTLPYRFDLAGDRTKMWFHIEGRDEVCILPSDASKALLMVSDNKRSDVIINKVLPVIKKYA